jgi:micrococcal nuclease
MKKSLLVLFILSYHVIIAQITGKVVGVHDGDTFTLLTKENVQYKVRLHGVDCPELKQDFGKVCKKYTSDVIFNKTVKVEYSKKDRYGRIVGIVISPNGKTLNEELLRYGYAWHYIKYDQNPKWDKLESDARNAKLGLWKQTNATPPWDYRKEKKKK